ncbi:glycosyltransferase [Streptomyces corynorhini]|uniref:D-inositol 3-phosphate glycosyltransferase n=1 Tax=Streptomyces corynorhini TaxID=2282652 RepID=A0A370BDT1_9ACTN|nr:glycosyltransferase [Streptomyces corynorhini]RDG37866.1 glycosyltransferase [Streptomyces corynorhini]
MKVLHVITGLGIGGAEQQLRLLLRQLPVDSDVITLTNPGAVADGIVADGGRVTDLAMTGNRDLGALPRLTRLVRQGRYDLVHTHLYRACLYGRFAARFAGVRTIVATEHSLGAVQIEGRPLTASARGLYLAGERLGTATVAVSATVARRLERWGVRPDRIHVVPNGIEAGRFAFDPAARRAARARLGLAPDAFVVGAVGRLTGGKRFDRLVRAVARLPGAQLLLVGEGPERGRLLRLAEECGAAGRVLLPGACQDPPPVTRTGAPGPHDPPDLPALLAAMDVSVSTSHDEAFGLASLEALAAGLPVLYVACPALEDLPPAAAPDARRISGSVPGLVEELGRLRSWHQERARLPVPPAVRHYDISHSAEQLMAVYERAARGRAAPIREVSCP